MPCVLSGDCRSEGWSRNGYRQRVRQSGKRARIGEEYPPKANAGRFAFVHGFPQEGDRLGRLSRAFHRAGNFPNKARPMPGDMQSESANENLASESPWVTGRAPRGCAARTATMGA
ncbi:hypothetical protein SBD_1665 [Streptomyces bottropensis ATCC 25435]|uniref:Uncharacterized protein n=1 Tax=Streptomyces bottropensis ATCC 25435 TaxID=1054862 RepID=M3F5G6_9ACTN|nr:hypothetical protein SBD_1665 [Streptomyces bottropensis ATCC 25435]